ncbi:MAG: hypothetical protein RID11_14245 [Roseovarius sp.]|uniref:hypothetical protein n=1 Tax=Roseovarius sp. TaxID=1486281 RepID=UPI0032EC1610
MFTRQAALCLTAGWAQQPRWTALYASQTLPRFQWLYTLQKRPPEGAVGRCAAVPAAP